VAVFPEATVQTCIVHLSRHCLDFISYKDRKTVAAALMGVYRAVDAASGKAALAVSKPAREVKNIPQSAGAGDGAGPKWFPPMRFTRTCAGWSTPRMRSTSAFSVRVLYFWRAGDPVAKIGVSAGSVDRQPTNAMEALNSKLRRAVSARGHFPTDEAAINLLFLVWNRSEKEWTMPAREWSLAKAQFAILFGGRFTRAMV
jgi:putative transposase